MNRKIYDVPEATNLRENDKLPLGQGGSNAVTVTLRSLKNFIKNGFTVLWKDVVNKPDFKPVATTGDYNDLIAKPTIPSKTSDLINDNQFTTSDETNKLIETKGFITKKEANTTFVATPKVTQIEAQAIVQIEVQSNSTYLIDCSSGVTEKIEILNFAGDLNTVTIYIKNVSKPIQIVYPKSAVFLTITPQSINEREEAQIQLNLNYVKYFGTGSAIM